MTRPPVAAELALRQQNADPALGAERAPRPGMARRRTQGGSMLLITIGVLASLVAILVATTATEQVTLRGIANRTSARRARLMAESGIQQALTTLSTQSATQTSQQDPWYLLGQTAAARYLVAGDSFRIQIVDAAGLVNLNTATQAQLTRLPLTQEQIDSLLDWRTAGLTPRPDGGKDEYYNNLTVPYNTKLQGLSTLDELLLVKGFTPSAIYAPQTNTYSTDPLPNKSDGTQYTIYDLCTVDSTSTLGGGAAGGGAGGGTTGGAGTLPNINTASLQQITQRGVPRNVATNIVQGRTRTPYTTYGALLGVNGVTTQVARTLVDNFSLSNTTTMTGKIDVNTASQAALQTVPGVTPDVASALVTYQNTGLRRLGDLFNVAGFSLQVARQALDSLSTNSQTFIVHSMGTAGSTKVSIDAVISISANGARILKVTQAPYADMSKQWGWDDQTSTDNVLLEATPQ